VLEYQTNIDNEGVDVWTLYLYALKSPVSRKKYQKRLENFFDFLEIKEDKIDVRCNNFLKLVNEAGSKWVFNILVKYMQFHLDRVNRKEITGATVRNYLKSVKLLCEMADININWRKISRGIPKGKNHADDRIPTLEEIRKLIEYPDRRIKSIVCTMTSSGIRLGAWDFLQWGHIRPITRKDGLGMEIVVAAKIIVYANEDEESFAFISSEAYNALKDWMDYRQNSGELIDEYSWVMRDLWDTQVKQGSGFISKPQKLKSSGIKRLIERALWAQGLRTRLVTGKKRHPFQAVHSYRKWFKTRCEIEGMKPANVETLLSHSIGISDSYYRPTENELLEEYLKISKSLVINENNDDEFREKIDILSQKNETHEHIIKSMQQQKDDAYITLSDQLMQLMEKVKRLENSSQPTTK
jgi:hypothetical protein